VIDDFDPTLEAIIAADPDLVLGYGLFNTEAADVEAAGIATLTVTGECGHARLPGSRAGQGLLTVMLEDIRTYGRLFGTSDTAEAAIADLETRIAAVRASREGAEPLTVAGAYFWGEQLSITGRHNLLNEQFDILGLTDVYEDLDEAFAEVSIETLLETDPQLIVLSHGFSGEDFDAALALLASQPGADQLTAIAEGNVIGLPSALRGPDPAAVDGLELLATQLAAE
jgi:iron complex transport system substrate-binding protein